MTKLKIFGLILAVIGQVLITVIFFWLLGEAFFGDRSIRWLDFGVLSIVYWMLIYVYLAKEPVDFKDPSQKTVGSLTIRWGAVYWYSILAIGFMACCLVLRGLLSFKIQCIVQAVLLFAFFVAEFVAAYTSSYVEDVFYKEESEKEGKRIIKSSLQTLIYTAEGSGAPSALVNRLNRLMGEARFITPSSNPEAKDLDQRVERLCGSIAIALTDFGMNSKQIYDEVEQLERTVAHRKKY